MPPELHILGLIVVFNIVAYAAIYPRIEPKTLHRLIGADIVLLGILLAIAGTVYAGLGLRFSVIFFTVNWWVFTLLAAMVIEVPFFLRFCRKWDIDLGGGP